MIFPIFIPIENIYCDDLIEEFEKKHSENFGDYSESKENDFLNQADENHKRLDCEECEKIFSDKRSLRRHIEIKHRGKKFKCKHNCNDGKIFKSETGLKYHYKVFHGEENGTKLKTNKCNFCGKNYQSSKKKHLKECEDYLKLTLECNLCQKRFTTEENLTLHVQAIHEHLKAYK